MALIAPSAFGVVAAEPALPPPPPVQPVQQLGLILFHLHPTALSQKISETNSKQDVTAGLLLWAAGVVVWGVGVGCGGVGVGCWGVGVWGPERSLGSVEVVREPVSFKQLLKPRPSCAEGAWDRRAWEAEEAEKWRGRTCGWAFLLEELLWILYTSPMFCYMTQGR